MKEAAITFSEGAAATHCVGCIVLVCQPCGVLCTAQKKKEIIQLRGSERQRSENAVKKRNTNSKNVFWARTNMFMSSAYLAECVKSVSLWPSRIVNRCIMIP